MEYAEFDENGKIKWLLVDWKTFDISKEELDDKNKQVYTEVAKECRKSQEYTIDFWNDRYTVRKISEIENFHLSTMTEEEKSKYLEKRLQEKIYEKREERDNLLAKVVDPVVTNPLRWEGLSEAEKSKYRAYRLYLLDIPQQEEFPDIEIKSFEEFLK